MDARSDFASLDQRFKHLLGRHAASDRPDAAVFAVLLAALGADDPVPVTATRRWLQHSLDTTQRAVVTDEGRWWGTVRKARRVVDPGRVDVRRESNARVGIGLLSRPVIAGSRRVTAFRPTLAVVVMQLLDRDHLDGSATTAVASSWLESRLGATRSAARAATGRLVAWDWLKRTRSERGVTVVRLPGRLGRGDPTTHLGATVDALLTDPMSDPIAAVIATVTHPAWSYSDLISHDHWETLLGTILDTRRRDAGLEPCGVTRWSSIGERRTRHLERELVEIFATPDPGRLDPGQLNAVLDYISESTGADRRADVAETRRVELSTAHAAVTGELRLSKHLAWLLGKAGEPCPDPRWVSAVERAASRRVVQPADRPAVHGWLAERVGAPIADRIAAIWEPPAVRVAVIVTQVAEKCGPPPAKTDLRPLPDWTAAVTPWVDSLPDRVHAAVVQALAVLVADARNADADDAYRALMTVMPRRVGRHAA